MRMFINRHQRNKSICRVLNNYPLAFQNKAKALAMKEEFNNQSEEVSDLISSLLRPSSTIHRPKQDSQQKFVATVFEYIGMGILLATDLENMPLLDILKVYKSKITKVSAYRLFEIAIHVSEELQKYPELAVAFGITEEKMAEFNDQISAFGETLDNTGALLTNRKSGWNDLRKQLLSCSKIIRNKLDPFIEFNETEFPDLFKDYMLVRGSRKRRKRAVKEDTTTCELSGVVTDKATGLPIANATIILLEHETVYTTDADGYYLIDELEAGAYTLSCHAAGYEVPEKVNTPLLAGESLIFDFSLKPVSPLNK